MLLCAYGHKVAPRLVYEAGKQQAQEVIMEIVVGELSLQDKAQWQALYRGYAEFYHAGAAFFSASLSLSRTL